MPDAPEKELFEIACSHAARFRATIGARPPRPMAGAQALSEAFSGPTPEHARPAQEVLAELVVAAEPGLTGNTGPRFFAWVMGASHPAGVAADWLTSAWGQNAGNFHCSPAAAMAEQACAAWLLDILDLPDQCSVGLVTGATMANFTCLAAARHEVLRRAGWDAEADGLFGAPPITVFIGASAHATVFSALQYLGLGRQRVIKIGDDAEGRMLPSELAACMRGIDGPKIVIAQAGQINTGAMDPFAEIAQLCRATGAWLHVDGAFGLWARACPELSALTAGVDAADSWATDGHKWLQTPYDCGIAIVRDADAHARAMGIRASYLPATRGAEYEPSQFVPELSRRARGFALWTVLKTLGRARIADLVRRHCRQAQRLAKRLCAVPGIRIGNQVSLNQVIARFGDEDTDAQTRAVLQHIRARNRVFLESAEWRGKLVMRISIISAPTTEADIDFLADEIIGAWQHVQAASPRRTAPRDAAQPLQAL